MVLLLVSVPMLPLKPIEIPRPVLPKLLLPPVAEIVPLLLRVIILASCIKIPVALLPLMPTPEMVPLLFKVPMLEVQTKQAPELPRIKIPVRPLIVPVLVKVPVMLAPLIMLIPTGLLLKALIVPLLVRLPMLGLPPVLPRMPIPAVRPLMVPLLVKVPVMLPPLRKLIPLLLLPEIVPPVLLVRLLIVAVLLIAMP